MLWGFISAYQFGHFHIWKGTINAEKYMQVLEKHIQMGSFPLQEVILHSGKHGILFICSNVSEFQLNSKWPYFFHKMVNFLSLNFFFILNC